MKRISVSAVLLGTGAFAVACAAEHHPPEHSEPLPTAKVETQVVTAMGLQGQEAVVGTVRAKLRATLEAKVSGRIRRLSVAVGQRVKRGQVVAELDVKEIRAKLAKAQAVLKQAEADRDRYQRLLKKKSVTQAEFEGVQARYSVAVATVTEVESILAYARVTAPFDGVVTHKLADVGDLASPGRPIVEIEDPSQLRFEAAVPDALSRFVGLGAELPVRVASIETPLTGTVSELAPAADPNSRTRLVKIDLPAQDNLRAGQFGRTLVPTGRTRVLRIPTSAVVRRGQLEIVFVAADNVATLRLVKTGKVVGELVEVVSGLDSGETIVVSDPSRLRDGQPIAGAS